MIERRRRTVLAWAALALALACGDPDRWPPAPDSATDPPDGPTLVVLGSAQDGGVPHAACSCVRCERARVDPGFRRSAPSLAVVVPGAKPWMIDASPDLPAQLARIATDRSGRVDRDPLAGIFLTHAHIGHYVGLVHLGREVASTRDVPLYATPRMIAFLESNAPWDQLVRLGNVRPHPTDPGETVDVGAGVRVTAFPVPHRDEYADTVGYRIEGPGLTVLYVPDTDRWETWDPPLESRLDGVDLALLDGTFHSLDELPGRNIEDVPHPPMVRTMDRLQSRVDAGLRVAFTHLNHSNPAVDPDSDAARAVRRRGFEIVQDGQAFSLGGVRSARRGP